MLYVAVSAFCLYVQAACASIMVNWDFSGGLTGWTSSGSVNAFGGGAVITDNGVLRSILYQGVVLSPGSYFLSFDFINALSGVVPAGQAYDSMFASLYFSTTPWLFDPQTVTGFDSFSALVDVDDNTATPTIGTVASSPLGGLYQQYAATFSVSQTSTVFFVLDFVDLNTVNNDSSFLVDNVSLIVPEPSIVALMLIGGGLGIRSMRRRKTA